jgi:1-acyl-sn-glycerol-3-phosphate acyltransferase
LSPLVWGALKMRTRGRENIDREHAQIIACNHTSQADPILVGCASGIETWFLAKGELFDFHPAFAWLIRKYNSLPVRRGGLDTAAFRSASRVLQQGRTLVLFPEGTRSKDGPLQPLKPGVAKLAIDNQVPIVPAFIQGARRSFLPWLVDPDIVRYHRRRASGDTIPNRSDSSHVPSRMKFRFSSLFTSRITVFFGKPLSPQGCVKTKEDYLKLTAQLDQALRAMALDAERSTQDARRVTPDALRVTPEAGCCTDSARNNEKRQA